MNILIYALIGAASFFGFVFFASKYFNVDPEDAEQFMPTLIVSTLAGIIWPASIPLAILAFGGYALIKKVYERGNK